MKRNEQNNPQNTGYPQQNGYAPNVFQSGAPYPEYQAQQGFTQPQGYPQGQGYPQPQSYSQPQGYTASRNYQTPQVTGNQQTVGSQNQSFSYTGQGSLLQNGYQQQGYAQNPGAYPAAAYIQPNGYPQSGAYSRVNGSSMNTGYGYQGGQAPGGSYIPQTPYSQGYASPGYQAGGYAQGYSAYNQMGRTPQMPPNTLQELNGQVPLNGGGYVPQPVPVRKKPFVLTDIYLLILSAVLLCLFALGMWMISSVKWAFLILAAGSIAMLWIKPMTDSNKRLCFTIVFALLALVTIIQVIPRSGGNDPTNTPLSGSDTAAVSVSGQADDVQNADAMPQGIATPVVTNTPEPNADYEVLTRLRSFFDFWSTNRQDDMLTLCSPSWASKEDNPKTALFALLRNRTPLNMVEENISGTSNDLSRTVTVVSEMDRNNGKPTVKYRMNIMMDKETDGLWYVNPKSLLSYDDADTPDPSITDTPAPTEAPAVYPNTVLYYNPGKGEYYHLDQNCKRIAEKYLPLQGHFTFAEINDEKYKKLKPCAVCGAPYREQ